MARVLVTGGAGFVGSHLIDQLLTEGHHVVCVDNMHTGRRANLAHHKNNSALEIVEHDVTAPLDVRVEHIYHLACPASPRHYQEDPIRTARTNFIGTLNMLELAKTCRARFLMASTSEVYGDPLEHPQRESYWGHVNCTGIRSCYDEGKRIAETLTFDFHRQHGVDVRVIRIFNTYGPRMHADDGRVVSNFIVQSLKNAKLTVYGDGSQTRSFCYVSDLVRGIVAMMEAKGVVGPINLGNPNEFTVLELAKKVIAMTETNTEVEHQPLPSDDPTRRQPDIRLAKERLGWAPTVSLDEGLRYTIAYFKQEIAS